MSLVSIRPMPWLLPRELEDACQQHNAGVNVDNVIRHILQGNGQPDILRMLVLESYGIEKAALELAEVLGVPGTVTTEALHTYKAQASLESRTLTGAETVACVCAQVGVQQAFAFAGTSELAICHALSRVPALQLINARGDKECAFMAAGASISQPSRGIGVLHGARGLTNATGAIADVRRNELGVLYLVGLPSTTSARFLPPHGEPGLIDAVGKFAKWSHEVSAIPSDASHCNRAARSFLDAIYEAIVQTRTRPYGPALLGLPQDVAETPWIPARMLLESSVPQAQRVPVPSRSALGAAAGALTSSNRVVILIDDYLLRYQGGGQALASFAQQLCAPVLQLQYRRGAMLFERLNRNDVPSFLGWWDPQSETQRMVLAAADMLVTLEDRNWYPRVAGPLPDCLKLAITSDASKTAKNGYLTERDFLLEGDVVEVLRAITDVIQTMSVKKRGKNAEWTATKPDPASITRLPEAVVRIRTGIAQAIADAMYAIEQPVLVDDSQMFGGLLAEEYDRFPPKLQVFGDHGGFVGAGIAYATGMGIARQSWVFCCIGDQAFTNGLQGFVSAVQEKAPIVYLVCNNLGSVSLIKQSVALGGERFHACLSSYLGNSPDFDYTRIAAALGMPAHVINLRPAEDISVAETGIANLRKTLDSVLRGAGPALIELRLPGAGDFWSGIWITRGFDGR